MDWRRVAGESGANHNLLVITLLLLPTKLSCYYDQDNVPYPIPGGDGVGDRRSEVPPSLCDVCLCICVEVFVVEGQRVCVVKGAVKMGEKSTERTSPA